MYHAGAQDKHIFTFGRMVEDIRFGLYFALAVGTNGLGHDIFRKYSAFYEVGSCLYRTEKNKLSGRRMTKIIVHFNSQIAVYGKIYFCSGLLLRVMGLARKMDDCIDFGKHAAI